MIEIVNENKAMAVKIWRESNDEVKQYLRMIIADEDADMMLLEISHSLRHKALMERTPND